jgi:hypothetical protein
VESDPKQKYQLKRIPKASKKPQEKAREGKKPRKKSTSEDNCGKGAPRSRRVLRSSKQTGKPAISLADDLKTTPI